MEIEMIVFSQRTDAVLDYGFEWDLADGESLFQSVCTVPAGLRKITQTMGVNITVVWLTGGTSGQDYTVSNHVTTDQGREDTKSFVLKVR